MFRRLILFVAVLSLLTACQDKREDISVPPLSLSETQVTIGPLGRYYTVNIGNVLPDDSVMTASTSSDWIQVDELSSSLIRFYVCPNDDESRRTATVRITTNLGSSATLSVIQRSDAESDANALPTGDNLTVQGRVGFGYDLMCDYMDQKSATELVFDYNALLLAEREYGTIVAQDRRNRLDYTLHTAYSIAEMAENLMSEQTDGVKFFGLSRKMTQYKSVKTFSSEVQSYGFAKISKIVATRYIDMGKIDALIREGRTDIFTGEFRKQYEAVLKDPSQNNIQELVKRYGTHVVTYADLGGRLEYTINFNAEQVSRDEMEATMKYKNGNLRDSDSKRRLEKLSNTNSSMCVTVYGGSPETAGTLQKASPTTDTNQQIPTSLLAAWLNTIANDSDNKDNLAMANCRLTPIWQLFPQENVRNSVLSYILRMSETIALSPEMRELLGVSGYKRFKIDDLRPDGFGNKENATLVKVAYVNNVPMLEICNEYVPQIRDDKRVTIIYPISNQRSNIHRGIFPGNGENPPCEVSFDEWGGCYVAQMEGFHPGDIIDSLYYIDGALYPESMNVVVADATNQLKMYDQMLTTNYSSMHETYFSCTTPIVKIGPGYWGRSCIKKPASLFGPGSILMTPVPGVDVLYINGSDWAPSNNNQQWWYYPTENDKDALLNYISYNLKALFKGGQTGLNTEFVGYQLHSFVEWSAIYKNNERVIMQPDACAMIFYRENDSANYYGTVLLLHPDYTFSELSNYYYINDYSWGEDMHSATQIEAPVYPFHGTKYKYPYR